MSMNLGGGKGGIKADINVTPLVDIMLVLLIIMMLIAPLLQKGVNVRLPLADNTTEKPSTQEQTVVHVDAQKGLYVNNIQVSESEAVDRIKFALEEKAERVVYLKADTDAPVLGHHEHDGQAARSRHRERRADHREQEEGWRRGRRLACLPTNTTAPKRSSGARPRTPVRT